MRRIRTFLCNGGTLPLCLLPPIESAPWRYLEIYNDRIFDLLNPGSGHKFEVKQHPTYGAYVPHLTSCAVTCAEEVRAVRWRGAAAVRGKFAHGLAVWCWIS